MFTFKYLLSLVLNILHFHPPTSTSLFFNVNVCLPCLCYRRPKRTWLLDMITHTFGSGGCWRPCALAHIFFATLHTVFCMIVHTANIFHATLLMSSLHDYCRRSIREVRRQNGRKITVGTQTLDKCWDYCKDLIPIKNKLLNAEIWNYVYQWQWRYHHRHALWQMVPKALKELCA
jgi:hypothetical protein